MREALTLALPPVSLQQPIRPGGSIQAGDTLASSRGTDDADHWVRRQYVAWVLTLLDDLEEKERRVRQIERSALNKLRERV